jgi:hypothetical protein
MLNTLPTYLTFNILTFLSFFFWQEGGLNSGFMLARQVLLLLDPHHRSLIF